jgi:flagella basal body P-ring formation protein FlgA
MPALLWHILAGIAALAALAPLAHAQEAVRMIDGAYVRERVLQALRARMPWNEESVRFEHWRLPEPFAVPADARGLRLHLTDELRRGAALEAGAARSELRDLREIPRDALSDLDTVLGQRTKVSVKAGAPLLASHFESPELVRRGDVLEVNAGRDGLYLRVAARALQPGRLGQQIQVENPSSRKSFAVRITGRGSAELAGAESGEPR